MIAKLGTNNIRQIRVGNTAAKVSSIFDELDDDAERFIIAANIDNPTIITAINNLVLGMKADNVWDKMGVVYPFVNGTEASCQLNLKDPTQYPIEFQGSWTFSADGVNSSDANSDIGIIPLVLDDVVGFNAGYWGMGIYSRTNSQDGYDLCALWIDDPSPRQQNVVITRFTDNKFYFGLPLAGGTWSVVNTDSRGFFQTNKSSGIVRAHKNGSLVFSALEPLANSPNQVIGLGNLPVITDKNPSGKQYAFCYVAVEGLQDAEAQALYATVQSFQTELGRNV